MDDQGEKTEDPTPRRREQAREKGQVARSTDLAGSVVGLLGFALLAVAGNWMLGRVNASSVFLLGNLHALDLSPASVNSHFTLGSMEFAITVLPLLGVLFFASFGVMAGQVGLRIATKPFEPDLSRLDPIKGFKRIVSVRGFVKLTTSILKIALVGTVLALLLTAQLPALMALMHQTSAQPVAAYLFRELVVFGLAGCAALLALSVFDYAFQRWQHTRDLRMTKHEVKDELRNMEGDPQLRKKRQEAQRRVAQGRMMHEAASADVMVTNPTHFTVAIKYPGGDAPPRLVAKGADKLALRLREIARENDVPIVERKELARALFRHVEIGDAIPEQHWKAIAEILAFIWRTDERKRRELLGVA